ncbi:MAG: PKD domain-containing protein, partial [Candidatus Heimdallarchaeota archaeon]|nr:PKD domain-containing protein [Candidatus Heimdallarchaeota archaeon]
MLPNYKAQKNVLFVILLLSFCFSFSKTISGYSIDTSLLETSNLPKSPIQQNAFAVNFTADSTYGDYPLVVSFESNVSSETKASFLWDFGDGVNSRLRAPTHAYTKPGEYDVTLTVKTNSPTIAQLKEENFITVIEEPAGELFYVTPSGDNAATGAAAHPWRDIWYGAEQLAPGDTLVVREGIYRLSSDYDEGFEISPNTGSETHGWVKIRAAPNESVILKGSEEIENGNYVGIDLTDRQYVAIQGLEIDGEGPPEPDANIRLGIWYENCHHLAFVDMNIHHISEEGIKGNSAHHILMEDVIITYSCYSAFDCGINDQPEYGVDEFTIRECYFSFSGRGGWNNPQDRADAVACEISEGTMYIEYSEAISNTGDGWDCKLKNAYIYNCITGDNLNNIKVWQNAVIENCIAYNLEGDTDWDSVFFDCGVENSKIVFCNNLIYKGRNYALCAGYDYPGTTCYITFYNNIIVLSDG